MKALPYYEAEPCRYPNWRDTPYRWHEDFKPWTPKHTQAWRLYRESIRWELNERVFELPTFYDWWECLFAPVWLIFCCVDWWRQRHFRRRLRKLDTQP